MKKIRSVALLSAAVLAVSSAGAYTVDEIVANGGSAVTLFYGNFKTNSRLTASRGAKMEKVDDTHIKISGFYLGVRDFTFTLVNNDQESTDGNQLRVYWNDADPSGWKLEAGFTYSDWRGQTAYNFVDYDYSYFDITEEDGIYTFTGTTPMCLADPSKSNLPDYDIFDKIVIKTLNPNASASHTKTTYTYTMPTTRRPNLTISRIASSKAEDYDLTINITNTGATKRFEMLNLGNFGYAVNRSNQPVLINGSIAEDGTVSFDSPQYAYTSDQWGSPGTMQGSYTRFVGYYYYYLTGFNYASSPTFPILTGTYTENDTPNHNTAEEAWVTNDGNRKTNVGYTMDLNPWTYYTTASANSAVDFKGDSFDNTVINGDIECTNQVELKLSSIGRTEDVLGLHGEVETTANPQYVDHYEICIVKGKYQSVKDAGFVHDVENGHVDGINIHSFAIGATGKNQMVPVSASKVNAKEGESATALRANDYTFKKHIPWSELKGCDYDTRDYTAFVKTVYKPETGLAPTFHSMQTFSNPSTTGIEAATADEADAPVEYFNLQGVRIAEPEAGGIYIRKQGSQVEKVRI